MSAHDSQLLAEGLVSALVASGVHDVVYCPGSRSAPLAYALADAERRGEVRVHVRLDERGAAFVAVGLSRAGMLGTGVPTLQDCGGRGSRPDTPLMDGRVPPRSHSGGQDNLPDEGDAASCAGVAGRAAAVTLAGARAVAVVTTSGGAVAELHAGVAEACHSGLPLIVVSADRPFELRGVGASQTTTQPGIFGPHVRATWDVPAGTLSDRRLTALVTRVVATAIGAPTGEPGPVHLNVGFRDPLVPDPATRRSGLTPISGVAGGAEAVCSAPASRLAAGTSGVGVRPFPLQPVAWEEVIDPGLRTVVVAGDGADPRAGEWARLADIPLLAEPSSGVTTSPAWVPHQQALLAPGAPGDGIEQVVLTGRPTLSRPVSALMAREGVRLVVHSPSPSWTDPAGHADVVVGALLDPVAPHEDHAWRQSWRRVGARVGERVRAELQSEGELTQASVAATVWEAPPGVLLLGASTPIRAVDLVAGAPGRADVVSNRGLAGIDGTIATARGLAWGSGQAVRALMGDLTFFHDASSLAATEGAEMVDVQVLVVDDHGGAIFAGLEHGRPEYAGDYPRWFATPQVASVEDLARAYGVAYQEVDTQVQLEALLAEPIRGLSVVHIRVWRDPRALARLAAAPDEERDALSAGPRASTGAPSRTGE
ncbi:MAG: 2-succinyl-5-enolpyruvyl-6-hydroxy-3-cyclohexene-1-carboxylate synthase [Propionibacterium sp.]|nr:2-succinyl-5-enolpyruvyl-6-hydroxy-3-cyclohexene-1-carboxylate synthase [Propionibacterium sp.]